jgi:hypothetical protein
MLVKFHRGFIKEGEYTYYKKKYPWSKAERVTRKTHCVSGVAGFCDESEVEAEVAKLLKEAISNKKNIKISEEMKISTYEWQRILTYEECLELAKQEEWESNCYIPSDKTFIEYLDTWTVAKAAEKLTGKQFAQYCKDYGITVSDCSCLK